MSLEPEQDQNAQTAPAQSDQTRAACESADENRAAVGYTCGTQVALFAVLGNLAVQFALGIVQGVLKNVRGVDPFESDYFQLCAMLLLQAAFIAVPLVFFGLVKKQKPQLFAPLRYTKKSLFGILLALLTLLAFFFFAQDFAVLLDKIGYDFSEGVHLDTPGKIVLAVVAMVIVAPIVEEIIFRGFLLSGLKECFGTCGAALLSGLAFSLMHMSPEQTVYQFFLGCVCALAAISCGSLLAPILLHAVSNLAALLLDLTPLGEKGLYRFANFALTHVWSAVLVSVGFAAVFGALLWLVLRAMRTVSSRTLPARKKPERTGTITYVAAVLVCAVMWGVVFWSAV